MADNDLRGNAWIIPPSQYIRKRTAAFTVSGPASCYLSMRDGCRLAIDLYLPGGADRGGGWPTLFIQTPYYRRFAVDPSAKHVEAAPDIAAYRDVFVGRGYALVVVDVRGTGASFGTRDIFQSPRERHDAHEVVQWITGQGWSNGMVGAAGAGYLGAAADFLATTSHSAVKAVAPMFSGWDSYLDDHFPGGVHAAESASAYDRLMVGLDQDRRDFLKGFERYASPVFAGPQPVDEDTDGSQLAMAIKEHAGNCRMPALLRAMEFREEPLEAFAGYASNNISPNAYVAGVRKDIAVYSVSGWMDNANTANDAISRFLSLPNEKKHLLLGPWDHGARTNGSRWRADERPEFDLYAELLRFFDEYLGLRKTALRAEKPVHYFSVHDEKWHAAESWPPVETNKALFFTKDSNLSEAAGKSAWDHQEIGCPKPGLFSRVEGIAAIEHRDDPVDRENQDGRLLTYTSAELPSDTQLTGHGLVNLWLNAVVSDFVIHAHLSELLPHGEDLHVTQGCLRALHRMEVIPPDDYLTPAIYHSCTRVHARQVTPGQPHLFRFSLRPIAWTFLAKSRIRLSVKVTHLDQREPMHASKSSRIIVLRGGGNASHIMLPLRSTYVGTQTEHLRHAAYERQ